MDRIDLLSLNARAPLIDAVRATAHHRWREAADLWLDVSREPRYRPLSALCGLEASLHAGLYDLAHYFHIGTDARAALPAFVAEPWRDSLPVRRLRARFHARRQEAASKGAAGRPARRLVALRLYPEAIRDVFRRRLLQTDRGRAVALLAACYAALGEHEALVALHRSQRPHFGGRDGRRMLEEARACLARESLDPLETVPDFVRRHPAGFLLTPLLDAPGSALAPYARA